MKIKQLNTVATIRAVMLSKQVAKKLVVIAREKKSIALQVKHFGEPKQITRYGSMNENSISPNETLEAYEYVNIRGICMKKEKKLVSLHNSTGRPRQNRNFKVGKRPAASGTKMYARLYGPERIYPRCPGNVKLLVYLSS